MKWTREHELTFAIACSGFATGVVLSLILLAVVGEIWVPIWTPLVLLPISLTELFVVVRKLRQIRGKTSWALWRKNEGGRRK